MELGPRSLGLKKIHLEDPYKIRCLGNYISEVWGVIRCDSVCTDPPRTGKLFRFRFSFSFRVVRVVRAKLCVRVRVSLLLGRVPGGRRPVVRRPSSVVPRRFRGFREIVENR